MRFVLLRVPKFLEVHSNEGGETWSPFKYPLLSKQEILRQKPRNHYRFQRNCKVKREKVRERGGGGG